MRTIPAILFALLLAMPVGHAQESGGWSAGEVRSKKIAAPAPQTIPQPVTVPAVPSPSVQQPAPPPASDVVSGNETVMGLLNAFSAQAAQQEAQHAAEDARNKQAAEQRRKKTLQDLKDLDKRLKTIEQRDPSQRVQSKPATSSKPRPSSSSKPPKPSSSTAATDTPPAGPVRGDLNHDGRVTDEDVTLAQEMAVNKIPPTAEADMNGDGRVNSADALLILREKK